MNAFCTVIISQLNNFGLAWKALNVHEEAIVNFRLALEIWIKKYGEEHPHTKTAKRALELYGPQAAGE